jgi:hypothetical protein
MSENRPTGINKTAKTSKYAVGIHPIIIAFIDNSWLICGRAILMEEPTKGVKKEARNARIRANDRVSFIMISGNNANNIIS